MPTKRIAAQRALQKLWNIDAALSEDEDQPMGSDDEPERNDSDEELHEWNSDDNGSSLESDNESVNSSISSLENQLLSGRDGTLWNRVENNHAISVGRFPAHNIFSGTPGVKAFAKRKIDSPLSAWRLIVSEGMLKLIQKYTIMKGKEASSDWCISLQELDAFLGLLYLRGVLGFRRHSINSIWSSQFGSPYFREVMSRNRFREILRFLRFDEQCSRRQRVEQDKYAHFREIFDLFVSNCLQVYTPNPFLTVDEQLLPLKNRCCFIQFMPNKPDKFGIKYWILSDVKTKFVINQMPYLGAHDRNERCGLRLGDFVVRKLMEPFFNKGYNVCTDNFFTSLSLAEHLLVNRTTLVGTVRLNSRFLSSAHLEKKPLFESTHLSCQNTVTVSYQGKSDKKVIVMSTFHSTASVRSDEKRKPEMIHFYNKNKTAVDTMDSMLRLYSSKAATARWPVATFYDLLDKAALNAHVIFKDATGSTIKRRDFIFELATSLCEEFKSRRTASPISGELCSEQPKLKKRKTCSAPHCDNKSGAICHVCSKVYCGKHSQMTVKCFGCV